MKKLIIKSLPLIIIVIQLLYVPILHADFQTERSEGFEKTAVISETHEFTEFSENILLSQSDFLYAHHVEPTIAISDNGTICAGWKNSETAIGGGARVSVIRSVDGGETWIDFEEMPMFVSKETSRQSDPWLVWGDETIFYAYLEFSYETNPFSQITVARSDDYGKTWTPSRATDAQYFADKETMVIDQDGNIFVAYDDVDVSDEEGNSTSKLTRSIDGGLTFTEISVIAPPDPGNVGPYLTVDNFGNLLVAWTWLTVDGGNLFFSRSSDQGTSWDEPVLINADGGYSAFTSFKGRPAKGTLPVIRVDQFDRLYVIFADKFDVAGNSFQ
ncbi:MAG: sialidase family protein [Candidatus Thorarchaeota archaeon]